MKKALALFLALVISLGMLAGCGATGGEEENPAGEGGEVETTYKDTIVYSMDSAPTGVYIPVYGLSDYDGVIAELVYASMLTPDPQGNLQPYLAESYGVSEDGLAYKYLHINCSVMSPNDNRLEFMEKMIDEFHVDGVIEIILQSCHTYNVESNFVKRMVTEKKGLAYMAVETDFSQSDKGQINTRLAAFLETIDK